MLLLNLPQVCSVLKSDSMVTTKSHNIIFVYWQINLTIYVSGFIKQLWERDGVSFEQLCQVYFSRSTLSLTVASALTSTKVIN